MYEHNNIYVNILFWFQLILELQRLINYANWYLLSIKFHDCWEAGVVETLDFNLVYTSFESYTESLLLCYKNN